MIIDALGWNLGQSFISPQTIIPMFIVRLTGSNLILGLVVAIQSLGQLLPQLISAHRLEKLHVKKYFVTFMGIIFARLPYIILAVMIFTHPSPFLILIIFLICWTVSNFSTGIIMPAYMSLFGKSVPFKLRGRVTGIGSSIGTFLAVLGAYLAKIFLEKSTSLNGYAWCFVTGFIILTVTIIPLAFTDEPEEVKKEENPDLHLFLKGLFSSIRENTQFIRYLFLQISMQAGYVGVAFITSYAVNRLGASEGMIAVCTAVLMGFTALGSLLFGFIGDRKGYRLVFILAALASVAAYGISALYPNLYIIYGVYALSGLLLGCIVINHNMTFDYCSEEQYTTFPAIVFTANMPVRVLFPLLAGFWLMLLICGLFLLLLPHRALSV